MTNAPDIRESRPGDLSGIERLYADAFPDEDLVPLVRGLLGLEQGVLSLVAIHDAAIAGHVAFTLCHVEKDGDTVALLAPLAVTPPRQKQGIGSKLVQAGFEHLKGAGIGRVVTLGDPAYYGRFGFKAEDSIAPPYPLPAEWRGAWQSVALDDDAQHLAHLKGKLSVPDPWQRAELWAP